MKNLILSFCFLTITFFNIQADDLINLVQDKYLNTKTFQAELLQVNIFSMQNTQLESTGNIFIDNSNLVIEYTKPYYQFIKSTNEFLTIYSKNENTAFISENNKQVLTTILHFQSLVSQDLQFISLSDNLQKYKVLKPVEPLTSLYIFIDIKTNLINKISYTDDMDNLIILNFLNQRLNKPLTKPIESFIIPSNTNIIYQ